jgi:ATP-binding cassette subfamily B protein
MRGFMPGTGPRSSIVIEKERSKSLWATLKRIWGYLGRERGGLMLVVLFTALSAAFTLTAPYLLGRLIDDTIVSRDVNGLIRGCTLLLGVYIAGTAANWLQSYIMAGVSQHTVKRLRFDLFDRLQLLPLRFFDSKTHGELMSRTTNDIDNVSLSLSQSVTQILTSVITLTGSLILMLRLSLWMTLLTLAMVPIVMAVTGLIAKHTRKHYGSQQRSLGELNGLIEETMAGQKVVKVFRREERTIAEFAAKNRTLRNASIRAQVFSGNMGPVMNMINNMTFALIAAVGGMLVLNDVITIGVIVSFLGYSRQFSNPINQLANQFNMFQGAVAGAERVFEIIDTPSEYSGEQASKPLAQVKGEVRFDNVSFSYRPGVDVLKHISFSAKPGEMIALVGPTGAGKTTVVNLLTRFHEIGEGAITIDGIDIRELDKNSLRRKLGIVLQDAYLFSDSIRENIRYGRLDATDEEVVEAARLANADGFICKMEQGYDSQLSAEGGNLSQGQRQLLTIARAILADPAILVLDEATSSVDTRTELHIQEAMRKLMIGRTSFVIAHRLSTIREADQILVIDGGEIIERGTHEQLLHQHGFYARLYESQFVRSQA